jgi:hypothetical protein
MDVAAHDRVSLLSRLWQPCPETCKGGSVFMSSAAPRIPCAKCNHELTEIIRMQVSYRPAPEAASGPKLTPESTAYEMRCLSPDCGHEFSHVVSSSSLE